MLVVILRGERRDCHWPQEAGRYPAQAHVAAWSVVLAVQAAAAVWYCRPGGKRRAGATAQAQA